MADSTCFATIYAASHDPRMVKARAAAAINGLTLSFPDFAVRPPNDKRDATFYSHFPLGKIPALVTKTGFTVVESPAITNFLADAGPAREQLLGSTVEERAKIQQWCWHAQLEFQSQVSIGIRPKLGYSEFNAETDGAARRNLERVLKYTEKQLEAGKWLAGTQELSLADLSVAGALQMAWSMWVGKEGDGGWGGKAKVVEWFERVRAYEGNKGAFDGFKYLD